MDPEKSNEWINGWLNNFFKDLKQKIDNLKKEIEKEWWGISWFFKALFKKEKEELTDEQKKTQEELDKLGGQLIQKSLSNFEDSLIWNEIEIQNSLEQDLEKEETVLWILSKNKLVKEWFMWFTSWLDDWVSIGGRTGKEIKADWFEFVLLSARKLSDDNSDWKADLTLDDLNKIWENLWKIKKVCEDAQITSGKTKEQVLAVCTQILKDKLKANNYDITQVNLTKEEMENKLNDFDDNSNDWWQPSDVENPEDSENQENPEN